MRYKKLSIDDYGGLEPFLDLTASQHNGMTYERFLWLVNAGFKGAGIGRASGMSASAGDIWIRRYKQEKKEVGRVVG